MATVIKCIVADKKAVDVLRLIKDFCLDPPVVEPMDDSTNSPALKTSGVTKAIMDLIDNAKKTGNKVVRTSQFRETCRAHNASPTGYSYALKQLLKNKKLKRGRMPNTYEVI